MSAFYLTLVAVLLAGFAARDQVTVAGLTSRQGQRAGVLAIGLILAILTAGFGAFAGKAVAPMLAPQAREFLGALVIGLAGIESLVIAPRYKAKEPTHSLFAAGLVLLVQQLTDAARFAVFGIAVAMNAPLAAGVGGALGGMVLIAAAWALPDPVLSPRARLVRRLVGVVLLVVAFWLGLSALGMV